MADNISDVLDEALTLADGGTYRKADVFIRAYPNHGKDKVRIFKVGADKKQILVAGNLELDPPDTESMETVISQKLLTVSQRDSILSFVSEWATAGLKTDAPVAEPSTEGITDLLASE